MSGNTSKLIAFNYFGGKFTFLDNIYGYFPTQFEHMCELMSGSAVISINYKAERPLVRTINEINGDITNFFTVLRDNPEELCERLLLTPVSEEEYISCWDTSEEPIEQARRFYVRVRQSFFGLGAQRKNKGWHMAKTKANAKGGETVSRWNNSIPKLYEVAEVLASNFQIINGDYKDCIDRIDSPQAFFYADPPYPVQSRVSKNDYKYEFDNDLHIKLAGDLRVIEGKAMISSYDNDLYRELYHDWNMVKLPKKLNGLRTKSQQECLWFNYDIRETVAFAKEMNLKKYGTVTKMQL